MRAEQHVNPREEVETKVERVRRLLEARDAPAAVLSGAAAVAWLTAGVTNPIERGHPASPLWLVVTPDDVAGVTTNVELPRLEVTLVERGIPLHGAVWYEDGAMGRAAEQLAGAPLGRCLRDDDGEADDDLVAIRLALLPAERERMRALGADATAALEGALREWRPGERDFEIQARAAERLERVGALGVCLFVGGDARVERFRHSLPVGAPVERLAMAVTVAERGGLHVAATRFVCAGGLAGPVAHALDTARAIEAAILDACRPGASYGDVLAAMDAAYSANGSPGGWRDHYQGGPVGYRQREFEIVPTQADSRWYATQLEDGHALAWNPSVAGGGKAEDTFLLDGGRTAQLTESADWPTVEVGGRARPAVLDVSTGEAA